MDVKNAPDTRGDEVTLQISLAPPDIEYARTVVPHQLRVWSGQVDRIQLTLDTLQPSGEQFGARWSASMPEMRAFLSQLSRDWDNLRIVDVGYSDADRHGVADAFFGGQRVPTKDFRGGPYYSYFYALSQVDTRFAFHVDADMMFGGGSRTWMTEAIAGLAQLPEVVFVNPLAGPPAGDGGHYAKSQAVRAPLSDSGYDADHVSTRVFLVDLPRMKRDLCPLTPSRQPGLRTRLRSIGRPDANRAAPEIIMSQRMETLGLKRFDFLGRRPGMWAVHPVVRTPSYFVNLDLLAARVEQGQFTMPQAGEYNLHDSMLDPSAETVIASGDSSAIS